MASAYKNWWRRGRSVLRAAVLALETNVRLKLPLDPPPVHRGTILGRAWDEGFSYGIHRMRSTYRAYVKIGHILGFLPFSVRALPR